MEIHPLESDSFDLLQNKQHIRVLLTLKKNQLIHDPQRHEFCGTKIINNA